MYGDKLTSEYGQNEGRRRDVIGRIQTAPIGNLVLNPGKCLAPEGAPSAGWEPTGHVVLKPSEAMALVSEIIETVFGHENKRCAPDEDVRLALRRRAVRRRTERAGGGAGDGPSRAGDAAGVETPS